MNRMIQFLALLFLLSSISFGQSAPGNITASGTTCGTTNACVVLLQGLNSGSATITLNGTFVATIQFEGTTDDNPTTNTNWYAVQGAPIGSATAVTSASTNNVWTFNTANLTGIRARASAYTSGTAAVIIRASPASASKGGVGAGSSLPSGTQGQIVSYPAAGTTVVGKNPWKWDATLFHSASGCGTDAGCDAQNAFSFLANNGLNLGGTVTLENETTVDIQHNPYCGNTSFGSALTPSLTPAKVTLIISDQVVNTLEVPIGMMAGGCTYNTFTPGHAVLTGPSPGAGGGGSQVTGAMLKMGASYPKAGSTTSPCTGCNTYSGTVTAVTDDNTAGSGASGCGWNFGGASGTGRVCVTGVSTHFTTELTNEGILAAPYNRVSNQVYGHIEIIDDTHLTITTQYGSQSAPLSGVTYSVAYPMVEWAIGGQGWLGSVNQGLIVQDLTADANNNAGSWGFINLAGAELNTLHNVHIQKFVSAGIVVAGNIPQSNSSDTIFLNPSSSCEAANSVDLLIGERTTGFATSAPFGIDTILFAAGGCDSNADGITPFIINGGNFAMNKFHVERSFQGYIGKVLACTKFPCPDTIFAGNTSVPTNIALTNGNFSCGSCGSAPPTAIELATSFAAPVSIKIENMQAVSNYTALLTDDNNSNTLSVANNGSLGQYLIDGAGKVSYTNANPVSGTEIANAASVCYNGTCNKASSGSLFPVSGPGGTTGQVQYNCSSAFCGNANLTFPNATSSGATFAVTQAGNNTDAIQITRNTDTAPTGNFVNFLSVAAVSQLKIDVSGNLTALSLSTSGTNGGVNFLEGTGAGLTAAAAHDLLFGDSTLHCLHQNLNNSDKACIPFAFTSPLVNTNGTVACATCVTSASSLTSTAIMTGAGSQGSQTPSATSTLSAGGNASFAGTVTALGACGSGTAGCLVLPQGSAQGHATANAIVKEAPAAVTAYENIEPGTSATGIRYGTNSAAVRTESFSELSGDATTSGSTAVTVVNVNGIKQFAPAMTTAAMGAQSSATCTNVTNMTWNIAANKNYILKCEIPVTIAASGTIQYCLGGPGTATSFSLVADGDLGTAGIWAQISTLAQTAYGTKTGASAVVAANTIHHVWAGIQNGATASGTALTLQTAANGTNNITVGANATCQLTQIN